MTERLSPEAKEEIRKRAEKATAGPWKAHYRVSPRGAYKHWHIGNEAGLCQITMLGLEHDYDFIAHARTDIPALLRENAELAAQIEGWMQQVANARDETEKAEAERDSLAAQVERLRKSLRTLLDRLDKGDIGIDYKWDASEISAEIETAKGALADGAGEEKG